MKRVYIILSIFGFIAPNIFVAKETIETGNVLLLLDPSATIKGMFATTISTAFVIDLLAVVLVFFIWTYYQAKKLKIKNVGLIWMLTLFFGMGGTFPLFLYWREKKKAVVEVN
ncbi:MAG: DUF2834 domain-containing protein [Bacteroidia bacterium]|nr:DUF2834 domain-containing protein [Bacteroidia bacterium]